MKGKAIAALIEMNERRKMARTILNGILAVRDGKGRFVGDAALRSLLRQYHEEMDAALLALARAFTENTKRAARRKVSA